MKDERSTTPGVVSSLIYYPPEINGWLDRYIGAAAALYGHSARPRKADVMVIFFIRGGLECLQQETQELEAKVAALPPKVPRQRGRPRKLVG